MEENKISLLVFGAPGSGKGTQARMLAESLPCLEVVSVGDLLRSEVSAGTAIGKEVSLVMSEGKLVSDIVVCEMALRKLRCIRHGFLLDGFPRNLRQAQFLSVVMNLLEREIDVAFKLEVAADIIVDRLSQRVVCKVCGSTSSLSAYGSGDGCEKCGSQEYVRRNDDDVSVIKHRLQEYEREVEVLECYYRDKVVKIDGNRSVNDVYNDMKSRLHRVNN
ncbi:MAG: adenylate kinase family protein [Aaplasma endosymbiont of Hyalomma asiaticum]